MQMSKVPIGLRISFNLCQDINDQSLVNRIKDILEQASSRVMEALEENSNSSVVKTEETFENIKEETIAQFGDRGGKKLILDAKKHVFKIVKPIKDNHNRKIAHLKNEAAEEAFENSSGSRKIISRKYLKSIGCNCNNECEPVPYVKQLRQHRRDRKHRRVRKDTT